MARARAFSPLALRSLTFTFCKQKMYNNICKISIMIFPMTEVAAHMIKQVLNNDFMSGSSRLHQRRETRPWLPVDHNEEQWISGWNDGSSCELRGTASYFTLASALLSRRNLTICWCPVLVQWNREVHPRQSFSSKSAPCCRNKKQLFNQTDTDSHYI